ncbi:MAG: hypothetical protein WCG31_04750 [Deltaproteobacteria bacterium]
MLDIHKKVIAYCIKALDGRLTGEGKIDANRESVGEWVQGHLLECYLCCLISEGIRVK